NPVERLRESLLKGDSKKAALIFSEQNRRYFTEFNATDGALLVTTEQAYLLMDFRYAEAARYEAKNATVVEFSSLSEKLKELLTGHGLDPVYLETVALSYAQAGRFERIFAQAGAKAVLDTQLDAAIVALRIVKSPHDVEKISAAQKI